MRVSKTKRIQRLPKAGHRPESDRKNGPIRKADSQLRRFRNNKRAAPSPR